MAWCPYGSWLFIFAICLVKCLLFRIWLWLARVSIKRSMRLLTIGVPNYDAEGRQLAQRDVCSWFLRTIPTKLGCALTSLCMVVTTWLTFVRMAMASSAMVCHFFFSSPFLIPFIPKVHHRQSHDSVGCNASEPSLVYFMGHVPCASAKFLLWAGMPKLV